MKQYITQHKIWMICLIFWLPLKVWSHGDVHQRIEVLSSKIAYQAEIALLLERAQLLRSDGDFRDALVDYKRVLRAKPNNVDALYYAAKSALEVKQLTDAQSWAERFFAQVKDPTNRASRARAYQLFSDIYLAKGDSPKALFYFRESMTLQKNPDPDNWLRLADLELQQNGYDKALATLKLALATSGTNISIQQKMVAISIAQKDYKTAVHYLDLQLVKSKSLYKVMLLVRKSEVLLLAGNKVKSEAVKQKAAHLFQTLPGKKKNHPSAKLIKQYLRESLYKLSN
ncbi:MAG: tetratricopeptide repeat protein [Thiotrichaceae bacterium]